MQKMSGKRMVIGRKADILSINVSNGFHAPVIFILSLSHSHRAGGQVPDLPRVVPLAAAAARGPGGRKRRCRGMHAVDVLLETYRGGLFVLSSIIPIATTESVYSYSVPGES